MSFRALWLLLLLVLLSFTGQVAPVMGATDQGIDIYQARREHDVITECLPVALHAAHTLLTGSPRQNHNWSLTLSRQRTLNQLCLAVFRCLKVMIAWARGEDRMGT